MSPLEDIIIELQHIMVAGSIPAGKVVQCLEAGHYHGRRRQRGLGTALSRVDIESSDQHTNEEVDNMAGNLVSGGEQ